MFCQILSNFGNSLINLWKFKVHSCIFILQFHPLWIDIIDHLLCSWILFNGSIILNPLIFDIFPWHEVNEKYFKFANQFFGGLQINLADVRREETIRFIIFYTLRGFRIFLSFFRLFTFHLLRLRLLVSFHLICLFNNFIKLNLIELNGRHWGLGRGFGHHSFLARIFTPERILIAIMFKTGCNFLIRVDRLFNLEQGIVSIL